MNARATLIKPSTIHFERLLPGPIERVWAYLTESKKRSTWLAAGEFDLRVGGRIELIFENDKLTEEKAPAGVTGGGLQKFEGKITRLEPLRLLAHTWKWGAGDSEVDLRARAARQGRAAHHPPPAAGGSRAQSRGRRRVGHARRHPRGPAERRETASVLDHARARDEGVRGGAVGGLLQERSTWPAAAPVRAPVSTRSTSSANDSLH